MSSPGSRNPPWQASVGMVTLLEFADPAGHAVIPVGSGGKFLLNAVHMQEAPPERNAAWESYWASLTSRCDADRGSP